MALKVLIADKEKGWRETLGKEFNHNGFEVADFYNGKSLQLKLSAEKVFSVVMNLDLEEYNGIQLLKYIRLSCPQTKVIVISDGKNALKDFNITDDLIRKMGAIGHLHKPAKANLVLKMVDDYVNFNQRDHKVTASVAAPDLNSPVVITDDKFTRIKLDELFTSSNLIFDIYVRLGQNKFLKLFNKGEYFEKGRLQSYVEAKTEYLYFLTSERRSYMQFMNELATKVVSKSYVDTEIKITLMKGVMEKYVEEAYTVGLKPSIIEYSKTICNNLYETLRGSPDLFMVLRDFEASDETEYSHSFIAAFFSVMVLRQFSWQTPKSIETMTLGALFHDLGMIKIPKTIKVIPEHSMTSQQKTIYQTHCDLGIAMLPQNHLITAAVKQIIFQHHEISDGSGFPHSLTDHKIFPMAKILSLVNYFSEMMIQQKLKPLDALRSILSDPQTRIRYNQEVLIALATVFTDPKSKVF